MADRQQVTLCVGVALVVAGLLALLWQGEKPARQAAATQTGKAASVPVKASAGAVDTMVRTIIGETVVLCSRSRARLYHCKRGDIDMARSEPELGWAATAWVIRNRAVHGGYGRGIHGVCKKRNQFEPWNNRTRELMAIPVHGEAYRRISLLAWSVLSGRTKDPTSGALYFMNVATVKKRRSNRAGKLVRKMPGWAVNHTIRIGRHDFYRGKTRQATPAVAGWLQRLTDIF